MRQSLNSVILALVLVVIVSTIACAQGNERWTTYHFTSQEWKGIHLISTEMSLQQLMPQGVRVSGSQVASIVGVTTRFYFGETFWSTHTSGGTDELLPGLRTTRLTNNSKVMYDRSWKLATAGLGPYILIPPRPNGLTFVWHLGCNGEVGSCESKYIAPTPKNPLQTVLGKHKVEIDLLPGGLLPQGVMVTINLAAFPDTFWSTVGKDDEVLPGFYLDYKHRGFWIDSNNWTLIKD